jgi:quercetin dioxygenase-like cupin family protein
MTVTQGIVRAPGAGTTIALGRSRLTFKVVGADTGGAYTAIEYLIAPDDGAPPHTHANEDEAFSILDGALTFQLGAQTLVAETGAFVFIPRGVRHAFANRSQAAVQTMMIVTPAGLEQYFVTLERLIGSRQADQKRIDALNAQYGLDFSES